jgi:hypothetical protein
MDDGWRSTALRAVRDATIGPPRRFRAVRVALGVSLLVAFVLVFPRLDQAPDWPGYATLWVLVAAVRATWETRQARGRAGAQVATAASSLAVYALIVVAVFALSATFGPTYEESALTAFMRSVDFPAVPFLIAIFAVLLSWRLWGAWLKAE